MPAVSPTCDHRDEQLLARVRGGEEDALEALYRRHAPAARAVASRTVTSRLTVEEVVQDAFFSVWRRADTYDERAGPVRPWVLAIVHHRAVDRVRRASERAHHASIDEAWMLPAADDAANHAERSDERARLLAAMRRLPASQRRVLGLAYFGERSMAEIAAMTGAPLGTVKSRARLGLAKMRSLLSEAGYC